MPLRKLTGAMTLAVVLGLVWACRTGLHIYYQYGAGTAHVHPWRIAIGRVGDMYATTHHAEQTTGPDLAGMGAMGGGAAITLLLNAARTALPR